jgi:hypothetical protein
MPFAAALQKSLQDRKNEFPAEFIRGDTLEDVLNRHLKTVERMGGDDVFTCILLLSPDGKTLSYGAAPTVPASYCRAAASIEVGLRSGSCGAAAYLGRPVYSVDIGKDPVWAACRELALQHGYRSCWSTPIRNAFGTMIGTFAILHRNRGKPTKEEIEAIDMIAEHVADAIIWFRDPINSARSFAPVLKLVSDNTEIHEQGARLVELAEQLLSKASDLDRHACQAEAEQTARALRSAAELSRTLAATLMMRIEMLRSGEPFQ